MVDATRLKIGEVSKQTDVAVGALRHYEDLDLLKSQRGDNGYRYYSPEAIRQVQFIKKAQFLGFSLDDISEGRCCTNRGCEWGNEVMFKYHQKQRLHELPHPQLVRV